MAAEFDLIDRIRARAGRGDASVVLGIGDDAAVLAPDPGCELVVTTDALILDRHFTDDWPSDAVGHTAMHASLSDLAAMAARPRWALLALTLPDDDPDWLDGFLDGFLTAAREHELHLVGGNIARGPLNIGVQLIGEVATGQAVTRRGARPGDRLAVTGTLGDAAAALALGDNAEADLRARLQRPIARVGAGQALAETARAMIDLSDGLLADLGHLLADGPGAEIDLDALPASPALRKVVPADDQRWRLQTGGGSDYELLVVLPPDADTASLAEAAGIAITSIGRITDSDGIECRTGTGEVPAGLGRGWDHFDHD